MYIRGVHAERSLRALRQLVHRYPLGLFTTAITSPSSSFPLLQTSHIPFILDVQDETSETELGTLRGHMATANPQAKAIIEEVEASESKSLERDVLVLFNLPAHHYVTPKFYTETKPSTGKVVPTWNYAAVQVYGRARVFVDTKSEETGSFLQTQISDLTKHNEATLMGFNGENGKPGPWEVTDAPNNYINLLKKAIIGIEITVERMEGKFKMSQEMSDQDVQGVVQGFKNLGTETGQTIASTVAGLHEQKKANRDNKCID